MLKLFSIMVFAGVASAINDRAAQLIKHNCIKQCINTNTPTESPTRFPTESPTRFPTLSPTLSPTVSSTTVAPIECPCLIDAIPTSCINSEGVYTVNFAFPVELIINEESCSFCDNRGCVPNNINNNQYNACLNTYCL